MVVGEAAVARHEASRTRALLEVLAVLGLAAVFLSIMSAYETVNAGFGPKAFLVGRMAVLVLLCTWFLRRSGERWSELGLSRPKRLWLVPLLVLGGFVALVIAANIVRNFLVPTLGLEPPPPNPLTGIRGDFPEYLFYATLVSWGSAAFGEELLLRGFVLNRLLKLIGQSTGAAFLAVVAQAVIFGSLHLHQGANALVAMAAGLVLGLVWLLGGHNLWACIILHGIVDLTSHTNYYLGPGQGL
jgi:membrane protease YdiL (CAAX protease family)